MKKVLSLVLAFAMILGSFGFVFASDFPDVKDTEYFSEPVNVLSGLGVIGGFPDGTFKPEKVVTRAEMATMVVNALGMTVTGQADTKFSDVSKAHWASGFINYAASVGFIAGFPDGTFKPDQEVTYDQALTMIVAAEGYKSESLTGTWPGNFVNQARALGILDICKTTGSAKAPRQDIACFLYDALTNKLGYTDKDGAFHPNLDKDGKETDTMLTRLGAKEYDTPFVVTEKTADESLIDLDNYFGAYVTVYRTNDKDAKIVAIAEVLSEFIEGDADDLADAYKAYKTATQKDYVSFKNGESKDPGDDYVPMTGNLKLAVKLSGKTIKEVYSVQVWENGKTFMFGEDSADDFEAKTPSINGSKFALTEDDEIDTAGFIMNGAASLSEIKEDDVVTVYERADGTVARIDVCSDTVDGTVTKINAKETAFTIAGTAYALDDDAIDPDGNVLDKTGMKKLMDNETEATFYLTYAGDIYTYSVEEEGTDNYAIFLEGGEDAARYSGSTLYARLFVADGSEKEFEVNVKKADGTPMYANKAALNTAFPAGTLVKYTVNTKDVVTGLEKAPETITMGTTDKFDANGVFKNEALKSTTVVFSLVGTDKTKADSFKVIKAEDLFGAHVDGGTYFVTKGNYDAAYVEGATSVDKTYAIFIKAAGSTKDGALWTALYDGDVATLTLADAATVTKAEAAKYTTPDGVSAKLAVLTMSDDVVTDIDASKVGAAGGVATGKTTLSGSVLTANSKKYSLDADVKVYVLGDDGWETGTKNGLAMSASAYTEMYLINVDDDAEVEIVLVIK